MTLGHLFFAFGTTAYILIAIQIEERDLVRFHGGRYEQYQRQASMILPLPKMRKELQPDSGRHARPIKVGLVPLNSWVRGSAHFHIVTLAISVKHANLKLNFRRSHAEPYAAMFAVERLPGLSPFVSRT